MNVKSVLFIRKLLGKSTFFMFLFFTSILLAQTGNLNVKGVVSGEDGMPIPGASVVLVKNGKTTGAVTDFDGVYSIEASIGDTLTFSYLGMTSQSIKVIGAELNVVLKAELDELEEVVVIGYGAVKKKELTGAVTQVKAEALEKIVSADLGSALQGQAAGVNVVASSTPGGDSEILIRGITSLDNNTPLYVVDGIVQEGDPRIPPTDIETIDILKDAASTAIYGARGATGVIIITTKQGKPGTLQVRYNGNYAIQRRQAAVPLMNSVEQTYFDVVTQRNTGGALDDEVRLQILQNPISFQNETNLNDILFRQDVPTQTHNLNISGGTADITYNVALGFFDQEGIQVNSAYQRFNTRFNTVYQKNKVRLQSSLAFIQDNRDIPQGNLLSQAIVYRPTQNGLDLDSFDELEQGGDDVNRLGWVLESLRTEQNQKSVRVNGSFRIDYDITKKLKFTSNVGITTYNSYRKDYRPYQEIFNTQGILQSQPINSYIDNRTNYNRSLNINAGLTYQTTLAEDHKFTFAFFADRERYQNEAFRARRLEATNPDARVLNLATGDQSVTSGFDYTTTRIGTIGRVLYGYKGRYLLSASVRRDGSSLVSYLVSPKKQWGTFPGVSFAWNASDEPFWSKYKRIVNNFKVRLSHGTIGNDRVRPYSFIPGIEQNINYIGNSGTGDFVSLGATQLDFANKTLKWESTTTSNVGIDLGFLKNKLTLTAEYYYADKQDMLFPVFLPLSAGGGNNATVTLNVGNMVNKGLELTAAYRGKLGKVRFNMNGTFSTNDNEITKINGNSNFQLTNDFGLVGRAPQQSRVTALATGHEAGAFFLWRTDGIIDTEEKLAEYQLIDNNARMGDTRFIDQNNDGILDDNDRVYSGSGLPKYELGYTLNLNYKSWDFSMNWYAALGQEIMNGFDAWAYGFGRHKDLLYQWSEANTDSPIPAYRNDVRRHPNYLGYSDLWLEDGSYLRLRQVSLGYAIPKKTVEKWGLKYLRFYVRTQNPLTFTKYSGYNPEIGGGVVSRGLDKDTGPISIQYLFGMNLNF
ncbi:SusC/RagA family TonB-linked outer membrane protein [Seonamhaeicola marinus]|uniref:TonB-dependent receptor n=1 Tax=Seonamhaeicola marinus TaxID=1912246 RepID=A0A5D0J8S4_9FLAO|nr:TonB-dependent receptor [Seonamhaeicola marinus]TYA92144.1 TonB-dependent receptor [Seonamhaeicola marinus]